MAVPPFLRLTPRLSLVLIALVLTGCERGVETFQVTRPDGTAIELRDRRNRPGETENLIEAGEPAEFSFKEPLDLGEIREIEVRVSGNAGPVSFSLEDGSGNGLNSFSFTDLMDGSFDGGDSVAGIWRVNSSGSAHSIIFTSDGEDARVGNVRFSSRDTPPSADFRELVIGPGVQVTLESDGDGTPAWATRFSGEPGYRALELSYSYDRPEDAELFAAPFIELEVSSGSQNTVRAIPLAPGTRSMMVDAPRGSAPFSVRVVGSYPGFAPARIELVPLEVVDPAIGMIGMDDLVTAGTQDWEPQDYAVYRWDLYPDILVFDTRDYSVQSDLFKRLAFFAEKRGFRGQLASPEDLIHRHGWNAHNYSAEGMAAFFNKAREQSIQLSPREQQLLEIAIEAGILRENSGVIEPVIGGLVSVSQESTPAHRKLLINHEAMHGIFYREPQFRDGVFRLWNEVFTAQEREYWRRFLGYMTYDPADEYLMVNEMQAYLLQQSIREVRWVFRTRYAERLSSSVHVEPGYVEDFLAAHPDTFLRAAQALNELLWEHTGLVGGTIAEDPLSAGR